MNEKKWCRICEFETVHKDGKCTICALFKPDEQCELLLEDVREIHPEVSEEDE